MEWIFALVGLIIGALVAWLVASSRHGRELQRVQDEFQHVKVEAARSEEHAKLLDPLREEINQMVKAKEAIDAELTKERSLVAGLQAQLEEKERSFTAQMELLTEAQETLKKVFDSAANEALRQTREDFFSLAEKHFEKKIQENDGQLNKREEAINQMVKPLQEKLKELDETTRNMEEKRAGSYEKLMQQLEHLAQDQNLLRKETKSLVTALRNPVRRGQWGEIQLRRVAELAGMLQYCDFVLQESVDENRLRPDMIVRLPAGQSIIVDAKAPLAAYINATEADSEEERRALMLDHARQVKDHVKLLGKKEYQAQVEGAPAFVVLFLPGEPIFSAALEADPGLIEEGMDRGVLIATPLTLIALLKSAAMGWRHDQLQKEAKEIGIQAAEIYKRLTTFVNHFVGIGRNLNQAMKAYDETVGSLEGSVLPKARDIHKLAHLSSTELPEPHRYGKVVREIKKSELSAAVEPSALPFEDAQDAPVKTD